MIDLQVPLGQMASNSLVGTKNLQSPSRLEGGAACRTTPGTKKLAETPKDKMVPTILKRLPITNFASSWDKNKADEKCAVVTEKNGLKMTVQLKKGKTEPSPSKESTDGLADESKGDKSNCESAELKKVLDNVRKDLSVAGIVEKPNDVKSESKFNSKADNDKLTDVKAVVPPASESVDIAKTKVISTSNSEQSPKSAKETSAGPIKADQISILLLNDMELEDDMSIDLTEEEEEALLARSDTNEADEPPKEHESFDQGGCSSPSPRSSSPSPRSSSPLEAKCVDSEPKSSPRADSVIEIESSPPTEPYVPLDTTPSNEHDECELSSSLEKSPSSSPVKLKETQDDEDKTEGLSWSFSASTPTKVASKEVVSEVPEFENTAKEEGMQEAFNKVVEDILTEIETVEEMNENETNVSQEECKRVSPSPTLEEKKEAEESEESDPAGNSIIKRLLMEKTIKHQEESDIQVKDSEEQDSKEKDETLQKELVSSQIVEMEVEKTACEDTRKRQLSTSDDKPVDAAALTVKKVKLDTDSPKEEKEDEAISTPTLRSTQALDADKKDADEKESAIPLTLTRRELDDLVARRISLYFTEKEGSKIGALMLMCEQLQKSLDIWKKRASFAQKQMMELQIAFQRASHQNVKNVGPTQMIKMSTRTVGLQVQMHSFLIPDDKNPNRATPRSVVQHGVKMIPAVTSPASHPNPMGMPMTPRMPANAIQGPRMHAKPNILMSGSKLTPKVIHPHNLIKQSSSAVSILQPRIVNPQPIVSSLVTSPMTTASHIGVPKVANVIPPSTSAVRHIIDRRRVQPTTMSTSAQPVPMRLVPNQAAVKQVGPAVRPTSVAQPVVATPSTATPTPTAVKIIDLTSDEDENNMANQLHAAGVGAAALVPQTQTSPAVGEQKAVTLLTTTAIPQGVTTGQILISPSPVKTTLPGMPTGVKGAQTPQGIFQQPVSGVYLVPSTSLVRTPMYVTQTAQPRQIQPSNQTLVRPPVQAILLQKGTTIVPVQTPAPMTTVAHLQSVTNSVRGSAPATTGVRPPAMPVTTAMLSSSVPISVAAQNHVVPMGTNRNLAGQPMTTVARLPAPVNPTAANLTQSIVGQTVVVSKVAHKQHPAPLPLTLSMADKTPNLRNVPPKPALKISKVNNGIVLSWNMCLNATHAEIASYQLYAYQESTAPPSTSLWKKVGDVKALPLPMACTLTQFMEGHKYHFAVRAIDAHDRIGPFSDPGCIVLDGIRT